MDFWNRLLDARPGNRPSGPPEALSARAIDTGNRMYWLKAALAWDEARRVAVAAQVAAVIGAADFQLTDLERRYVVPDLDEHPHSGASLVALDEVLRALAQAED